MYLVSISLLLGSSCMIWLTLPVASIPGVKNIQYVFLALFCLIGCFTSGKMKTSRRSIEFLLMLVIYLLCFALIHIKSNVASYILKVVVTFVILYLYCNKLIQNRQLKDFARTYVNVISVVALVSVFFWLFGSVFGIIKGASNTYIWAGTRTTVNYYWVYFENATQATELFGQRVIRNTGIFSEAPAYSGYLIPALAIAILSPKGEYPRRQIALLIIAMLTTLSTKGQIAVVTLIVLQYMSKRSKDNLKFILKWVGATILLFAGAYIIYQLMIVKSTTGSFSARTVDLAAQIRTWMDHILFGTGYGEMDEVYKYAYILSGRAESGSMGLTMLLSQGGLYLFAFYALPLISSLAVSWRISREMFTRVLIFGVMCVFNLFISSMQYSPVMIIILACGYAFSVSAPYTVGYNRQSGRINHGSVDDLIRGKVKV